ncbi:hypothetical protein ACFL9U_00765 [Thermodesulfobacteriota bacterium]
MYLLKCTACEEFVSDEDATCPRCGANIETAKEKMAKRRSRGTTLVSIGFVVMTFVVAVRLLVTLPKAMTIAVIAIGMIGFTLVVIGWIMIPTLSDPPGK